MKFSILPGSIDVKFTLAPGETDDSTTNEAVSDLQNFLSDENKDLRLRGETLKMAPGSLKTTSVETPTGNSSERDPVTGLPLTTKIVLAVVFGLIGIAIIIAIIVICMR